MFRSPFCPQPAPEPPRLGSKTVAAYQGFFLKFLQVTLTDCLLEHVQESLLSSASSRTSSPGEEDSSCIPWICPPIRTSLTRLITYWNMFRSPFCPRPVPEPPHLERRTVAAYHGYVLQFVQVLLDWSLIGTCSGVPSVLGQLQNLLAWGGGQDATHHGHGHSSGWKHKKIEMELKERKKKKDRRK